MTSPCEKRRRHSTSKHSNSVPRPTLRRLPIWAFHRERDLVVQVGETRRMIEALRDKNPRFKCTIEPDVGHWIHWSVYPGDELYEWFLEHDKGVKSSRNGP